MGNDIYNNIMKINPNEVYWNEDRTEYAVLVSPGWGAGWSSWNYSENNRIAWDRRIVEFILRKKECGGEGTEDDEWDEEEGLFEENKEFLRILDECGIDSKRVYFGGAYNIEVKWVKPGDRWRIDEEDGAEVLETLDPDRWCVVEKAEQEETRMARPTARRRFERKDTKAIADGIPQKHRKFPFGGDGGERPAATGDGFAEPQGAKEEGEKEHNDKV